MYAWPQQKRFNFQTYGENESIRLAKAWARKGNYFMQMWHDAGADYASDLGGYVDGYSDGLDFLDWAVTVPVESLTFTRICEVRAAVPTQMLGDGTGTGAAE